MNERKPKWYIHRFRDLYADGCTTEIQVNRLGTVYTGWVRAVCEPYTAGAIFAAWEVLRGRAFAFEWPKPGDVEKITGQFQVSTPAQDPRP